MSSAINGNCGSNGSVSVIIVVVAGDEGDGNAMRGLKALSLIDG